MGRRSELNEVLKTVLGSPYVYFQPPESMKIEYPAIVYNLDDIDTKFAGNTPYASTKRYQVTHIYRDPDSPVTEKIAALPLTSFSRHYTADLLNHDSFSLYF